MPRRCSSGLVVKTMRFVTMKRPVRSIPTTRSLSGAWLIFISASAARQSRTLLAPHSPSCSPRTAATLENNLSGRPSVAAHLTLLTKENSHVAYRNSDARGNRKHGSAPSRGNRGYRHFRRLPLRSRIEARGHVTRADDSGCRGTHQFAAHPDRRSAPKAVSRKADRGEDAGGDWFDALRNVGPWLGSSHAVVIDLRLCWTSAGVFARLFAHDEAAVDSVEHCVDGNCAPG